MLWCWICRDCFVIVFFQWCFQSLILYDFMVVSFFQFHLKFYAYVYVSHIRNYRPLQNLLQKKSQGAQESGGWSEGPGACCLKMQIYSLRFPVVEVTPFTSGNYDLHVTPWGNKKRVWEIPPQSALTNIYWWVNPINTAATGFSICWIDHQIYECSESALPTVTATLGARWATSSGNKREIVYLAKNGKPWDSNWNLMQTLRRLFFVGHHCANGGYCNNLWWMHWAQCHWRRGTSSACQSGAWNEATEPGVSL